MGAQMTQAALHLEWFVCCYFAGLSLALLVCMGADKAAAVAGRRRIPETTLLALAVLGGSAGGVLGMLLFRHKIRKPAFSVGFPLILLVQLALACVLLWDFLPESWQHVFEVFRVTVQTPGASEQ